MSEGVREAFRTGRGGIVVRAKMHIEDPNNPAALAAGNGNGASGKKRAKRSGGSSKPAVVVTELPYQTNKVGGGKTGLGGVVVSYPGTTWALVV